MKYIGPVDGHDIKSSKRP
nr:hypothetical protein [Trueperella pyogenes]